MARGNDDLALKLPVALTAGEMAGISGLVGSMTVAQKAALTAGRDMWSTHAISELGIPALRMTDGPNGARGRVLGPVGTRALCMPSGSALGATWDIDLVQQVGQVLGREARDRGARILLGPTVNIQRSPLAGRTFECFSEDPWLAGKISAGYVRGVQSEGVVATVKHLAGNEAEFERNSINSIIDERTLREIYLVPFEMAVREAGALGIMTGYNRLNGAFCADHQWLLSDILRGEWGFEGIVVTDWWAVAGTQEASAAGLDIEMPGPGRSFGLSLEKAVTSGSVASDLLDKIATRILSVLTRIGAREDIESTAEISRIDAQSTALARRAARDAMVLIKNDGELLPLEPSKTRKIAVIGPNAHRAQIMGGGSATLRAHHRTSPLEALRNATSDAGLSMEFAPGCVLSSEFSVIDASELRKTGDEGGMAIALYANQELAGEPFATGPADTTEFAFMGELVPGERAGPFSMRARGTYEGYGAGTYRFRLESNTPARLLLNGREVIAHGWDEGVVEEQMESAVDIDLAGHHGLDIIVEMTGNSATSFCQTILKCQTPQFPDMMDEAVDLARSADVAIVVVGTSSAIESEGFDRTLLSLPGEQDELIRRVYEANSQCIIVVNSGSPVLMPWLPQVPAVVQTWFGGQEMADALADILLGLGEPGGRMPITVPTCIEHNPAFGNFPGSGGEVRYGEGVLVGYRWYEARKLPVSVPFGHGLSYTRFAHHASISHDVLAIRDTPLTIRVTVENVGERAGSEVIQVYVTPSSSLYTRPPKELRGFAKVHLDPGESKTIEICLDARAFAYWSMENQLPEEVRSRLNDTPFAKFYQKPKVGAGWLVDAGSSIIHVARSSADIIASFPISLEDGFAGEVG